MDKIKSKYESKILLDLKNWLSQEDISRYKKYREDYGTVFPVIRLESKPRPYIVNNDDGRIIRNYIRENFPQIDNEMDYCQFEDYVVELITKLTE